jgi:hypothetical protein
MSKTARATIAVLTLALAAAMSTGAPSGGPHTASAAASSQGTPQPGDMTWG